MSQEDQNNNNNYKQELISQIINYSSVYETLKCSMDQDYILEPLDFLIYFIQNKCNDKTLAAYRCLCLFSDKQLVTLNGETKHFLSWVKDDRYAAIYNLSYPGSNLPGITDKENILLAQVFQTVWAKLLTHNTYSKNIYLISDTGNVKIGHKDLVLLLCSRSMHHFSSFINNKNIMSPTFYLNLDMLDFLEDLAFAEIEDSIYQRCSWLQQVAPLYWDRVARPLYQVFISKKVDLTVPIFCKCKVEQYLKLFPNLFPQNIIDMSNIEYSLRLFSPLIQGYILGLPIHLYLPSQDMVDNCIEQLLNLGIEEYAKHVADRNKQLLQNFSEYMNSYTVSTQFPGFNLANEQDTMMEWVQDYNLFDVLRYWSGQDNHVYYFTRPEFPTLTAKNKNHWNSSKLPKYFIKDMEHRQYLAHRYELPPPDTVLNMLLRLEKGENIRLVENNISSSNSDDVDDMSLEYPQLPSIPLDPNINDITVTRLSNGAWTINMLIDQSELELMDNYDILPAPALPASPSDYYQDLYDTSTENDEDDYEDEDDYDDYSSYEVESVD